MPDRHAACQTTCLLLAGALAMLGSGTALEPVARPARAEEPNPAVADAAREQAPFAELNEALAAARARLEELGRDAGIVAEVAGLRTELRELQEDNQRLEGALAEALSDRDEAAARSEAAQRSAAELQQTVERLRQEASEARTAFEQARNAAEEDLEAARQQARQEKARGDRLEAESGRMEAQITGLREAADMATAAARQNLTALDDGIGTLHAALIDAPQESTSDAAGSRSPASGAEKAGEAIAAMIESAKAGPQAPDAAARQAPRGDLAADAEEQLTALKGSGARQDGARLEPIAAFTADLPLEPRLQAQSLLADLDAHADLSGVRMSVAGEKLFTTNSDRIGEGAHETLAKVAEVIDIYAGRQVVITGIPTPRAMPPTIGRCRSGGRSW